MLGKISANDILIFYYFSQKKAFDISCKLSLLGTICRKSQNLCGCVLGNKINIINLSFDEFAQRAIGAKHSHADLIIAYARIVKPENVA